MGYTHSWDSIKFKGEKAINAFSLAKTIVKTVVVNPLFGQFVTDLPDDKDTFSGIQIGRKDMSICINGYTQKPPGKIDLSHESLALVFNADEEEDFSAYAFCKTNRKPYDLTCVALLSLFEMNGLIANTHSDGYVDNFKVNSEKAIRHSVNECLCLYASDEDVKRMYTLPTADDAVEAFKAVCIKLQIKLSLLAKRKARLHTLSRKSDPWF